MGNGSREPPWLVWRWVVLLSLFLLLFLLVSTRIAWSENLQSIESNLLDLLKNCEMLKGQLTKQRVDLQTYQKLLSTLQDQLADSAKQISDLQEQLTNLQGSASDSQKALTRLTELLTQSETSLASLSTQFEAYKGAEAKRLRNWQITALSAIATTLIATLVAIVK